MLYLDDTYDSEERDGVKYKDGHWYSLTIKPDDKFQCTSDITAYARILTFYQLYSAKMERLFPAKHFEYYFRIEISEPIGRDVCTPPRLHLHGKVFIKDRFGVLHWLLMAVPDLLIHARLQIGVLEDHTKWDNYIHKQSRFIPKDYSTITNTVKVEDPLRGGPSHP